VTQNIRFLFAFSFLGLFGSTESIQNKELHVFLQEMDQAPYDYDSPAAIQAAVDPAIFGYLLKIDRFGDLAPSLIKSWNYDFKTKSYTLVLADAKFHNGREITAKDLEFSIVVNYLEKTESYSHFFYDEIEGLSAAKSGMKFKSGMVSGIQVVNSKTIRIKLAKTNSRFLYKLTSPFAALIPQEEMNSDYSAWKRFPIGAGPYRIEKPYANHEVILQKVSSDLKIPDRIFLHTKRMLDRYDLLLQNAVPSSAENDFKVSIADRPSSVTSFVFINRSALSNQIDFRKALHLGFNREAAVLDSVQMKPTTSLFLQAQSGMMISGGFQNPFQLAEAKRLFSRLPSHLTRKPVQVVVYSPNERSFPPVIEKQIGELKKQFEEIGFQVQFTPNTENPLSEKSLNRFDLSLTTLILDWSDPLLIFNSLVSTSPYRNEVPKNDGKVDRLFQQAEAAATNDDRFLKIRKLSDYVDQNLLILPVFKRYTLYRINPKTVVSLGDQLMPQYLDFTLVQMR
jgi:ABC-type oligopeptide transport system substrate-binding subunit